jgi:hypothetical protein
MLATQKTRHRRSSEGRCRREGGSRYFGFVTQAVGQHFGFCVSFCHSLNFTSVIQVMNLPWRYPCYQRVRYTSPSTLGPKGLLQAKSGLLAGLPVKAC